MTGLIEQIAELMNAGHSDLTFSLSNVKYLLPEARICYTPMLFATFMIFCVWDDMRSENRQDRKPGRDPE